MTKKRYAGIGSRSTPAYILDLMSLLAYKLEQDDWILHSGGAAGADAAFESGVLDSKNKQIFIPSQTFNQRSHNVNGCIDATTLLCWSQAIETVQEFHPAPQRLSKFALSLMARNAFQVLGKDLNTPVSMVVCWTPNAAIIGGTGQALRMAIKYGIPIKNLGDAQVLNRIHDYLGLRDARTHDYDVSNIYEGKQVVDTQH